MRNVYTDSGSVSSQEPNQSKPDRKQSNPKLNVLVVFSPVSLKFLEECGKIKSEDLLAENEKKRKAEVEKKKKEGGLGHHFRSAQLDHSGCIFSNVKYFNTVEWEYGSQTTKNADYEEKIFIDCSEAHGNDLFAANNVEQSGKVVQATPSSLKDSALMAELFFAVKELKDALFTREWKNPSYSKGEVNLYVCSFHPIECLMFAFLKIVGISVDKQDLYKDFVNAACSDPFLGSTKKWLKDDHKWSVNLHYCSIHNLYFEQSVSLSERGQKMKRLEEMEDLYDYLNNCTYDLMQVYKKHSDDVVWHRDNTPGYKEYKKAIDEWKVKARKEGYVATTLHGEGEYLEFDYPAVEFEGKYRTAGRFNSMINYQIKQETKPPTEDELKQQKTELDKRVKEEEEKLKDYEEQLNKGRLKDFHNQQEKTNARFACGDAEDFWEERYSQDHALDKVSNQTVHDDEKRWVTFEGKQLKDEKDQKKAEDEITAELNKRKKEIAKLKEAAAKIGEILDDIVWDRWLTRIQLGVAIACMVIAPFAAGPMAGIIIGIAASAIDAGLEITKWGVVDDFERNNATHIKNLCLDVVFAAFAPIFNKLKLLKFQKTAEQVEKEMQLAAEVEKANQAVAAVADTAQEVRRLEGLSNTAKSEARELRQMAESATDAGEKVKFYTQYNEKMGEAMEHYVAALEKDAIAVEKGKVGSALEQHTRALEQQQKASKALVDQQIKNAQAQGLSFERYVQKTGPQRLEELRQQSNNWIKAFDQPLRNPNEPVKMFTTDLVAGIFKGESKKKNAAAAVRAMFGYDISAEMKNNMGLLTDPYLKWTATKMRASYIIANTYKNYVFVGNGISCFFGD